MGRDASQMSRWPRTKFLKPPPVPDLSTLSATPRCCLLNSWATACESLKTVLEPSISIFPVRLAPLSAVPPGVAVGVPAEPPPEQPISAAMIVDCQIQLRVRMRIVGSYRVESRQVSSGISSAPYRQI